MTVNTPSENTPTINDEQKWHDLVTRIKDIGAELGFDALGISDTDLESDEAHLEQWLKHNYHGEMDYMQRHGRKRSRPEALIPGTLRIISARIDYAPDDIVDAEAVLEQEGVGYVSRYALGRDYHKVLRKKLQSLAHRVEQLIGPFGYRVFTDSAPVLEKALAQKAGLGWIGKHTNLIDKDTGSWFFLGEIYTDLPLPIDQPAYAHCGTCARCIDICPTQAIVAPFQLDARRCISYLTIELKSAIPLEFRRAMGNRIYGCDDCQLVCPWNKFASSAKEIDFSARAQLKDRHLTDLLAWDEAAFLAATEGTAIRRIGFERWQRNVCVAAGNALAEPSTPIDLKQSLTAALLSILPTLSPMVAEHAQWALDQTTH